MGSTIRVMTWNIHGTFNLNPGFDLEAVVKIIEKWAPDIVALQEVDSRGRRDDPFRRLATVVGEYNVQAASIVTKDGSYGQALLSRWPFLRKPDVVDVSYGEREPRRAIVAPIQSSAGNVTVIATHLGLSIGERVEQAKAIAKLVTDEKTIIMGDFNDWLWVKSVRRVLARHCPARTRLRTFPAWFPILRLDRVYVGPGGQVVSVATDRDSISVSDHLPVIADITWDYGRFIERQ